MRKPRIAQPLPAPADKDYRLPLRAAALMTGTDEAELAAAMRRGGLDPSVGFTMAEINLLMLVNLKGLDETMRILTEAAARRVATAAGEPPALPGGGS